MAAVPGAASPNGPPDRAAFTRIRDPVSPQMYGGNSQSKRGPQGRDRSVCDQAAHLEGRLFEDDVGFDVLHLQAGI